MSSVDDQIDTLADEFEKTWTSQSIHHLEKIIVSAQEENRHIIFDELVLMDIELRFKNGINVNVDGYVKQFSLYCDHVPALYKKVMSSRQLGEYEYYESIGKGGMGHVYHGYHRLLERDVAIKVLRKDIDQSLSTDRFLREMRLGAKLSHDNIVKYEYAGCEAGRYYLVSELVHGKDIHKIVESNGALPIPVACEILRQIATGLQYAFEQNIVHRDIKPGNVMISRNGTVKILDFGLGKIISDEQSDNNYSLTTLGTTMGSVDYCAPEQWENASTVTIRSDIYSLGCLFFFMLTGRAPFELPELNREQRMVAHFKNEVPSLHSFCENLPDGVEKCFKKMMAKKPSHRFAKPIDIALRIEPYTVKEPLEWLAEQGDSSFNNSGAASTVFFAKRANKFSHAVFTKYLPPAALLLLLGYGIHYFSAAKYQPNQNTPNTSTQKISPRDTAPSLELSKVSMAESLQFVGYSGKWWFEEIPWYLPVVRETFRSLGNTNISKQKLDELAFSFVPQSDGMKGLLDFLILNGCPTVKNLTEYEALVNVYISETETATAVSASTLHTHAVLLHRLAELTNNPELAYQTRKLYIQAAQCYESENADSSHLLRKLCLFDVAFLNLWIDANPEDFFRQVNAIETNQNDDIAFRAELLISP
ncbi:MAG: serine/threonine protein kinase, partial [Planctomycetaceae bacterium]|nr:serine/threonine protein kinase [Planctomycetaceae bacterium]